MTGLNKQLIDQIKREGPISLAQFMSCALYDPSLGYYASGRAKIGKSGDFYTNVSVGPLFGKLLARQFSQMWHLLGEPPGWTLIEQGAFDGSLASDVLNALEQQAPDCYEATTLTLIEPFATLQEAQSLTLKKHSGKTSWKRNLGACAPFSGVHYSNELLDAFPAHQVRYTEGRWVERCIGCEGDGLAWTEAEITNPELQNAVKRLTAPEEGAIREVSPIQEAWLEELSRKLTNGWILICDYGLTEEELALPHRCSGTLTGYRKHRRSVSPIEQPGDQDITYQVNFTNMSYLAEKLDLQTVIFTEQSRFLTGIAPLHFEDSLGLPTKEKQREMSEFRTLTHPDLLGCRFKTMLLSKGRPATEAPAGGRFAPQKTSIIC